MRRPPRAGRAQTPRRQPIAATGGGGFLLTRALKSFAALACLLSGVLVGPAPARAEVANAVPAGAVGDAPVDFVQNIRPVLEARCWSCHGEERQKGGLRLDRRSSALKGGSSLGPAIVPGDGAGSPLLRVVAGLDPEVKMPPKGEPLSAAEIERLRAWIDQGAVWPEAAIEQVREPHWSFQPIASPRPPAPTNRRWVRNAIDAFILDRLERIGLEPSPEADRRTLIRRLHFDLTGLPPTPEEVQAFARDRRSDAYERLVDRLLGSPHYGERWARHWLDVVRFAETHGFEMNQPRPNAWPYRDYVIRALNEDKPYNRFVLEQLAGDALGCDEATGFLVAGPWDQVKSPDVVLTSNQRADELHDVVSTAGTAFLGLTLGCARCHEHKFDPIPQRDYYAVKAVFEGVQHGERAWRTPDREARRAEADQVRAQLVRVERQLNAFEPLGFTGATVVLDETAAGTPSPDGPTAHDLVPTAVKGEYAPGTGRGERNDPGDASRAPTPSVSYRAWQGVPGRDVFAWEPRVNGRLHLFASWGSGWSTHASDARYILDRDGDLATTGDQVELARVDQRKFADGSGEVPNRPLWSGFHSLGTWALEPSSRIVLRGGDSDAYVAADTLVLQAAEDEAPAGRTATAPTLRRPVNPRENVERMAPTPARRLRFTILATTGGEPCLDELEVYTAGPDSKNIALASGGTRVTASGTYPNNPFHQLEHLNDGHTGNRRSWISDSIGQGWVELEFPETVVVDRIVWGRDRLGEFRDRLATEYRIEVATTTAPTDTEWRRVASAADRVPYLEGRTVNPAFGLAAADPSSQARLADLSAERDRLEARRKEFDTDRLVYAGEFKPPEPTRRFQRGDPMQPREAVSPGPLSDIARHLAFPLASTNATESQRRLAFAAWVTDPANPLTPRVAVNRVWQQHFGEGLVSTPSDFGANGARPSHPELLDWLASEFVAHGWSLKHLHRLIVTSATYRQDSRADPVALKRDAGSRWLWRFPPRRLEAEAIRDTILAVSGNLDLTPGGPGFSLFEPNDNYVRVYKPRQRYGPAECRRMVYATQVRQRLDGVFGVFDCPDGGQVAPRRTRSTTPLQALNLLNSAFVLDQAGVLAKRLEQEAGPQPDAQIGRAFALAFNRAPDDLEREAAVELIENHGLPAFCRALLNANELVYLF